MSLDVTVLCLVLNVLRDTSIFGRSRFPFHKVIDVILKSWIFIDDAVQHLFVFSKLNLQMPNIPNIDLVLEFVDFDAPIETRFKGREKVIDSHHFRLVSYINKLSPGIFETD